MRAAQSRAVNAGREEKGQFQQNSRSPGKRPSPGWEPNQPREGKSIPVLGVLQRCCHEGGISRELWDHSQRLLQQPPLRAAENWLCSRREKRDPRKLPKFRGFGLFRPQNTSKQHCSTTTGISFPQDLCCQLQQGWDRIFHQEKPMLVGSPAFSSVKSMDMHFHP